MLCQGMLAVVALLNWTMPDGRNVLEEVTLTSSADGEIFRLSREKIRSMGAKRLDIVPEFARAAKGEAGYWFTPYGIYGEYDRKDGRFFASPERMPMPMFGWSNPRGAFLAIVTSLKYFVRETVTASNGEYAIAATLEEDLCRDPYEDLVIEYRRRPAGTSYADLAKIYRAYQLERGAVKPLKARFAENKVLEQAVLAPEIRIRQAWKPVPSPVLHQAPENEPEVKAMVTFDRVKDIVDELKRQGVANAELCLVGWNIGGHDGRWPQYFPAEPKLGGDAKLKEAIRHALDAGYLIVPHGNFYEEYVIADNWSAEATIKDANGLPLGTRAHSWGGGKPYHLCPQRGYEMHMKIIPRLAAYGFKGLGYFDVVTICEPKLCTDARHSCTSADGAKYWGACAAISKRELGGFASESGNDYFAGNLDYSLYTYFGDPLKIEADYAVGKGLAKRVVPIWQIVYNGIIANNPFTITMNAPLKDRAAQLKLIEFSARPCFYFYSKFLTVGKNWMGDADLTCGTDEELKKSVSLIKEGYDAYQKVKHLQLEFIEGHEQIAEGVFRTTYSNGVSTICNYTKDPVSVDGFVVPSLSYEIVPSKTQNLKDNLMAIATSSPRRYVVSWTHPWPEYGSACAQRDRNGKWAAKALDAISLDGYVRREAGVDPLLYFTDLSCGIGTWLGQDEYARNLANMEGFVKKAYDEWHSIPVFSWHLGNPYAPNREKLPQKAEKQNFRYRYSCDGYPQEHRYVIREILEGAGEPCGMGRANVRHAEDLPSFANPRAWYDWHLEKISAFLKRLVDRNGDPIPVVVRLFHECEDDWQWWGAGSVKRDDYVKIYRYTVGELRRRTGLGSLLFMYSPDRHWETCENPKSKNDFLFRYPGDDVVDLIGFDDYSIGGVPKGWVGDKESGIEAAMKETIRKARLVSAFSLSHKKPAGIAETSASGVTGITGLKLELAHGYDVLRRVMNAEGVALAFFNTWGPSYTVPSTDEGKKGWKELLSLPETLVSASKVNLTHYAPTHE